MKVWPIVMLVFIFSAYTNVVEYYGGVGGVHVNEVGINTTSINTTGATIYEIDTDGEPVYDEGEDEGVIAGVEMLGKALITFVKIIGNTIYVRGILMSYAVPEVIADMIQGIVTIIQVVGVVQFASNRRVERG